MDDEISIRKVVGASLQSLVYLVSKEFMILVIINMNMFVIMNVLIIYIIQIRDIFQVLIT